MSVNYLTRPRLLLVRCRKSLLETTFTKKQLRTRDRFSRNVFSWKPAGKMAGRAQTACDGVDDVSKRRKVGDSKLLL